MVAYISALVVLGLALTAIALQKTYYYFPARELKRQARGGDHEAAVFYRAAAYGSSLRLLLWFIIGVSVAAGFVLLTTVAPGWLVFFPVAGLIWYGFAWSPNARVTGFGVRLTLLLTPLVAWVLYHSHSLLDRIVRYFERHRPAVFHSGLFEREDLIELIKNQRDLGGSRIPHAELDLVLHALSFGDKAVQNVMVSKGDVSMVKDNDVIGPVLMDELYESKHTRFPVIAAETGDIVGILHLRDMIAAAHGGSVQNVMKPGINFVHEDHTLRQVLHAFLTTKQHLFAVINSEEDYVGIITIEDVLEQIIGHRIADDFDGYDDKHAVAAAAQDKGNDETGSEVEPDEDNQ